MAYYVQRYCSVHYAIIIIYSPTWISLISNIIIRIILINIILLLEYYP
jgi:hypothetical protein